MKALVIGLGSMGKRRIRCLKALGVKEICGFDLRSDRREEAVSKYGIDLAEKITPDFIKNFDFTIISVPPNHHFQYMSQSLSAGRHFFIEVSIIDEGFREMGEQARAKNIVAAPSLTMVFHPGVQRIISAVQTGEIGKVCNFIYHSGQYLPDWHPYEKVSDFYVSNPETGGAREILPFELAWLIRCFKYPQKVSAAVAKTTRIEGAEKIDDTYSLLFRFGDKLGTLIIDVVSRFATRRMTVVGEKGQIEWDWNQNAVRIYNGETKQWKIEDYSVSKAAEGYNVNISEQMYIDEIQAFLQACAGEKDFPNTLKEDAQVLQILRAAERSSLEGIEVALTM